MASIAARSKWRSFFLNSRQKRTRRCIHCGIGETLLCNVSSWSPTEDGGLRGQISASAVYRVAARYADGSDSFFTPLVLPPGSEADGFIAGIIVAVIVIAVLLVVCLLAATILYRRRRRSKATKQR